jgi:hypothetical protein
MYESGNEAWRLRTCDYSVKDSIAIPAAHSCIEYLNRGASQPFDKIVAEVLAGDVFDLLLIEPISVLHPVLVFQHLDAVLVEIVLNAGHSYVFDRKIRHLMCLEITSWHIFGVEIKAVGLHRFKQLISTKEVESCVSIFHDNIGCKLRLSFQILQVVE